METYVSADGVCQQKMPLFEDSGSILLLSSLEFGTKNKNMNTSHGTYQEALNHAKQQVGDFGPDDVTLVDDNFQEIGRYTSDKKRGYRVDADHVNWWATRNGHTEAGHARWTSREVVPNAEAGNGQYEWYQGNLTDTGRR